MRQLIRTKNFYLMLALDSGLIVAAYLFAYLLRFEGHIPDEQWLALKSSIPYILPF